MKTIDANMEALRVEEAKQDEENTKYDAISNYFDKMIDRNRQEIRRVAIAFGYKFNEAKSLFIENITETL